MSFYVANVAIIKIKPELQQDFSYFFNVTDLTIMLFCNIRQIQSIFYDHEHDVQPIHDDHLL